MTDINALWHEHVVGGCFHGGLWYVHKVGTRNKYACFDCEETFMGLPDDMEEAKVCAIPAYDKDPAVFKEAVVWLWDQRCYMKRKKPDRYMWFTPLNIFVDMDPDPQRAAMKAYIKLKGADCE